MKYREFIAAKAAELTSNDTPFLDASLILAHCMGIGRDTLLTRFPEEMTVTPASFAACWERRLAGEGVAYILGKKEFFGREFSVDPRVLTPRPDTETLVMAALEIGDSTQSTLTTPLRVHDVCTGSGIVAISLACERPGWSISASDISPEALSVAQANVRGLTAGKVELFLSDLFSDISGAFDVITANPPYVSTLETDVLLSKGWKEPRLALDGGEDGMECVRRLVIDAYEYLAPGGFLLVETDALQVPLVCDIFKNRGYEDIRSWKDLSGKERVSGARKPRLERG